MMGDSAEKSRPLKPLSAVGPRELRYGNGMLQLVHLLLSWHHAPLRHATANAVRTPPLIKCCAAPTDEHATAIEEVTIEQISAMFADVREHYRKTSNGDITEGQVCRNMMVTRVDDFKSISRARVEPSQLHGDGLFATRDIEEGDLITFFPADALLFWADGDRSGDVMCHFGAHVPQDERDASHIVTERVKSYELYINAALSAVGDPARRSEAAYLGHFANDGSTCDAPERVTEYRAASAAAANACAVVVQHCHFALQASRSIRTGEEVLLTYGEGYWLARGGHRGEGIDLQRVGAGVPNEGRPNGKLDAAVRASRQPKLAKKAPSKAGAKAKARKQAAAAARPASKGFGS